MRLDHDGVLLRELPQGEPFLGGGGAANSRVTPAPQARQRLKATPFVWQDPTTIPPREWLYGDHYIREFVSSTIAPGGLGKTSLIFVEAVAMATGRNLLGCSPVHPLRVWVWNGEDPERELRRRLAAAMLHYNVSAADVGDRLYVDSGRVLPIKLVKRQRDDTAVAEPLVDDLIYEIRERKIDVLVIDPFVSSHDVPENDNGAIDRVAKTWARIADVTGCSIELIHHVRKSGSGSGFGVEDARGAVALIDAVRSARVLNGMTADQGEKADIPPAEVRSYFSVSNGKGSMIPPAKAHTTWRRLVSVPLGNGNKLYPNGDWVGVAVEWTMPETFEDVTLFDLREVQGKIAEADWALNFQATNWAGHAIADVLGINIVEKAANARVKEILATWIKNKTLRTERVKDKRHGREQTLVRVGEPV